ncbi:MAG: citrate transporter [Anaerolineae bacterium]|jgi:Na+/H+ antiporter NhaD/arsenite permease-like protein|nr:citrate transporter [Anaerolineae bacterium]
MAPIVAALIVAVTLALIFTDKLNHTIAALAGATVMVGAGKIMGFYSDSQVLESIEFDALALLLGMMMLVSILEPTGFFQYVAVRAGQLSRGDPWRLLLLLGGGTAIVSLFFNNVTTVVLIGPVTILISELLGINPVPILMAQALLSDTIDVGTSVGDPASVLVASASGYSFTDFLTHSMPIVAVAGVLTLVMLRFLFRNELAIRPTNPEVVMNLDADAALKDRQTMRRVLIVLAVTIGLFLFQKNLDLSSGFIALAASAVALVWVRPDVREVLERVDWSVLLFFIGLFVMVGGLEEAGAFEPLITALTDIGRTNPRLLGIIIIWVVAAIAALVDNVPVTIAMISLLQGLAAAGVDVSALWWAVVFGAGFGGDATSIGTAANIIVVSLSQRTRTPITPALWSRKGLPVAIATCVVGSILYALFFPWLGR